ARASTYSRMASTTGSSGSSPGTSARRSSTWTTSPFLAVSVTVCAGGEDGVWAELSLASSLTGSTRVCFAHALARARARARFLLIRFCFFLWHDIATPSLATERTPCDVLCLGCRPRGERKIGRASCREGVE